MLGASKPVHEPAPNAAVSHPAALRQVTQSGVRPLMHFVRQCCAVHPAKSPKHPAQPLLQPLPAMHELTHEPLPKHFVPQDVMSDCHWECPASPFHFVVSASVQEPAPNAAVSHPAALRQVTQSGVRPLMHF